MAMEVKIRPIVAVEAFGSPAKNWIYEFFFDKDIDNKFLVRNPSAVILIILSYLLFVKVVGPFLMRNKKPFNLKNVMIIYNFMNAAFSLGLACMMFYIISKYWHQRCGVKRNMEVSSIVQNLYPVGWLWFLNKNFDLLDTIFFILRKKNNNVSILHVFHHAGLVLIGLAVIKFQAYSFFLVIGIFLNSLIHVKMYIYYALAAFGPHMQKYLWWKKYMTQMQIVQFLIILAYMGHAFATGCERMEAHEITIFIFVFLILILFLNFYRKNYKHHQT